MRDQNPASLFPMTAERAFAAHKICIRSIASALNARRTTFGKRSYSSKVASSFAGKSRQQRAVRQPNLSASSGGFTPPKSIEKPDAENHHRAHSIVHVQVRKSWKRDVWPPAQRPLPNSAGWWNKFAQGGGDDLNLRMLFHDSVNHCKE